MNLRDTSLAWLRDERGESGVGLLIVAPAIGLLIAIAVMGGRIGAAQTSIESAAGVAAREATLARNPGQAESNARQSARMTLDPTSHAAPRTSRWTPPPCATPRHPRVRLRHHHLHGAALRPGHPRHSRVLDHHRRRHVPRGHLSREGLSMIARFRAWLGREHGESSLLVLMLVPIIVLVGFGIGIDWNGKVRASEEAVTIAHQAARAGANAGTTAGAARGEDITLDRAAAARAAQGMIAEAGATGTVNVTPTKVTVDVDVPYTPRFIPTGVLTGHGQGTAQIHSNTR